MAAVSNAGLPPPQRFSHEALLYAGQDDFAAGTMTFIGEALAADEPILVAETPDKITLLRSLLGSDADAVSFVDMASVGGNPARIIPVWQDFVAQHTGRRVRGIGEPIWAGRSPAELAECQLHESLLNLAFAESNPWRLLCPYDLEGLDAAVIDGAVRSHPVIVQDSALQHSAGYRDGVAVPVAFGDPLPEPAGPTLEWPFAAADLELLRNVLAREAADAGLAAARTADLVLAANEIATNSVRHGGGRGLLRVWLDDAALVCEIHDSGLVAHQLAGRIRPANDFEGGRGLWLVNQLCDLVQLRSGSQGTVVRLRVKRDPAV